MSCLPLALERGPGPEQILGGVRSVEREDFPSIGRQQVRLELVHAVEREDFPSIGRQQVA